MKTIKVSDEVYDRLKRFLVDPFEDTAETIVTRLVEIAEKAQTKWSAWEEADTGIPPVGIRHRPQSPANQQETEQPVIL